MTQKDSLRGLASDLKTFLAGHEEDDFITAAATQAAVAVSACEEESAPAVPSQDIQDPALRREYKDTLTVQFVRDAASAAQTPAQTQTPAAQETLRADAPEFFEESKPQEPIMTTAEKTAALAELAETIKTCRRCPLGATRINAVPGEGNPDARLMFIGEGPGYEEDRQGRPFVGRAGQLLDKMIAAMGLKREEVFIANIAKCHPMTDPTNPDLHGNDRAPNSGEIASCRKYLEQQIAIILPEYVVALGGVSAKALIADTKSLGALRGKFHNLHLDTAELKRPVKILATYHPAALLRNPGWKKDAWADLQMVMAEMGLKPAK